MSPDRRTFLQQAAMAASIVAVAGDAGNAAAQAPSRTLNASLLAAMGDTVLPESLGASGRELAVRSFAAWLAGYKPVSEEMHGYGNQEITYTIPDPAPGWNAQLDGLELLARRRHGRGFATLGLQARRELVRSQLARQRTGALPGNPLAAPHVVVALLAHWAGSSEATDLAYGVRIARNSCRALADSPRKPQPLAPPVRR
jgi:hypothetical protein